MVVCIAVLKKYGSFYFLAVVFCRIMGSIFIFLP
jgi:hypothetical protein